MAKRSDQRSILIVDGDILVRHALADYLRQCGYVVIEGASTDEAVTVLSDASVLVDAILCDAEAPGALNPFQFRLWAAGQQHRQGVEIALAGNIETAANKAAELCENGPHLARPYDPQGVVQYIRRMIGHAD
jgi:CheY-like chemotaxis protein